MPLCVGEDADDDAGGEESGRRANEGAEDQTTAHEDEGEEMKPRDAPLTVE